MTDDPHTIIGHPQWATRRTITLICGPPGSGKTTLARQLHRNILDMDEIPPGTPRERMRRFGRLAYQAGKTITPNLGVIRGAPLEAERQHLEGLCHPWRTIILLTDADTCHHRIDARDRPGPDGRDVAGQHAAVDAWWQAWANEQRVPTDETTGYDWP